MNNTISVSVFELTMSLSHALDLVSPLVVDHHHRVAYIATSIARELGMPRKAQEDILLGGLLHDIGAIALTERLDTFKFEGEPPHHHAETGYRLLKECENFDTVAALVRFHHKPWDNGRGATFAQETVPESSQVLHLADRIAVLLDRRGEALSQKSLICEAIMSGSGKKFMPEHVDAFLTLSTRDFFWFDLLSPSLSNRLASFSMWTHVYFGLAEINNLAKCFSKMIDFRSRFTATHSSGVAATAHAMGSLVGMSEHECALLRVSGYLHDLGKLAVPAEILEKPARLTDQEMHIVRKHPYLTAQILGTIKGFETVGQWAALHHETLDGKGYPFSRQASELPLGSRIMAVADVFTALTEDRPYRAGMSMEAAMRVLQEMAGRRALDPFLVSLLCKNYDGINAVRARSQGIEAGEYAGFSKSVPQ